MSLVISMQFVQLSQANRPTLLKNETFLYAIIICRVCVYDG